MLDHCSIFHKGGIVLWSRSFTPAASNAMTAAASPVNNLVREALIEGRTTENNYERDGYAIKWTFANDLELIFVVVYQRILQLTYAEDLLTAVKNVFLSLYEPFLTTFVASLHGKTSPSNATGANQGSSSVVETWDLSKVLSGWDKAFDKVLKLIEDKVALERKSRLRGAPKQPIMQPSPPSSDETLTTPSNDVEEGHDPQEISRNVEALKNRLKGSTPVRGGRRRPAKNSRPGSALSKDSPNATDSDVGAGKRKPAKAKKAMRTWDDSLPTEGDVGNLDYSSEKPSDGNRVIDVSQLVDESSRGVRGSDGLYEIKDLDFGGDDEGDEGSEDDEQDDIIARALSSTSFGRNTGATISGVSSAPVSRFGTIGGLFSRITGSKVLSKEDLEPVLAGMKDHLMQKNVAQEIAIKICEGIGESLIGKRVSGFRGVKNEVRKALSDSITRILTPKTSTDLLLAIRTKLGSTLNSTSGPSTKRIPYIMTFVGVNGVGKSTNLSKVCFWLLQNNFRVLIAACDTFRSGAVEQLRVHVKNLGMLVSAQERSGIELYEKGYGKDAAGIAKEAIAYAKENAFDVVLIDTAGRMQDNEPLMRALAKLVSTNNPDKVIFVGEALVGNEAVDQLTKFDGALKNFSAASGAGQGRGIDGMLVTKWDTVDDKVGAALSMTYVTGQPILFVGCGQTYTDLRQLRVTHIVQALLSD